MEVDRVAEEREGLLVRANSREASKLVRQGEVVGGGTETGKKRTVHEISLGFRAFSAGGGTIGVFLSGGFPCPGSPFFFSLSLSLTGATRERARFIAHASFRHS